MFKNLILSRSKGLLHLCARRRWPWLAARLLALATSSLYRESGVPEKPHQSRYCVLVVNMDKESFVEDILECFDGSDEFNIIFWPGHALKAFAAEILTPTLEGKGYYVDEPDVKAAKADYRAFLAEMWKRFTAAQSIDAVLTANFSYRIQRELVAVVEAAGTPFICLHKENLKSPGRVKFWRPKYEGRGRFGGRRILVYNEVERDLQIAAGVSDEDRIVVTGMPRLDRLHRWRREHAGKSNGRATTQILFFSFDPKNKLPVDLGENEAAASLHADLTVDLWKFAWTELFQQTHWAMLELARKRPDLRVVIKTKSQLRHKTDVLALLEEASKEPLPPNLDVVLGGNPFDLIIESDVIVGFNTTALLEAMATGKPVIVPWFGEALDPKVHDLIIDLGEAVDYANSPDMLIELVCRYADVLPEVPLALSPASLASLQHWTGNPDGAAGDRVVVAVRQEIERARGGLSR